MHRELELELLDRAIARVESKETDFADRAAKQDTRAYSCEDRLAQERALLRRCPQIVAHVSELADPGSFVTFDALGVPIVAVRDSDGHLRAFVNACRHRGMRLVDKPRGRRLRAFVCPYHGWAYRTDGSLTHIPCPEAFPGADGLGLRSLAIFERYGFVWIVADHAQRKATSELLGPLEELDGFRFHEHSEILGESQCWNSNWKLLIEGGLEAYHVRRTHARSIYRTVFFDNCALVDELGAHSRIVFPRTNIHTLRNSPREQWRLRDVAYIGYLIFPNTSILVTPDHIIRMTVYPLSRFESQVSVSMLVSPYPGSERDWAVARHNRALMQRTLDEDFAMAEKITVGLKAPSQSDFVFGRMEHALTHFHRTLELCMSAPAPRDLTASSRFAQSTGERPSRSSGSQ